MSTEAWRRDPSDINQAHLLVGEKAEWRPLDLDGVRRTIFARPGIRVAWEAPKPLSARLRAILSILARLRERPYETAGGTLLIGIGLWLFVYVVPQLANVHGGVGQ
jgi:hypothetical protein